MDRGLSRFFQQLGTLIFFVLLLYGFYSGLKYIFYSLIEIGQPSSEQGLKNKDNDIDPSSRLQNLDNEYGISIAELNNPSKGVTDNSELSQISKNISLQDPEEIKKEISINQINKPISSKSVTAVDKECRKYPAEFITLVRNNGYKIESRLFEKPNIKIDLSNFSSMEQVTGLANTVKKSVKNILNNVTSLAKKLSSRHMTKGLEVLTTNKCKLIINEKKYNFTFKKNNLIKFELSAGEETFLFSKNLTSEKIEITYTTGDGIKHITNVSPKDSSISISQNDQLIFSASSYLDQLDKSLFLFEPSKNNILKVNFENGALTGPASIQNGSDSLETTFKNGLVSGLTKVFKSKKLVEETNYNQNIKNGIEKKYKNNSLYRQTAFKDGYITGKDSYFWEASGKIKLESNYLNNLKHGIEEEYNSNGLKARQTKYSHGIKDGEESFYGKDGNLFKKIKYVDGKQHLTLLYKDNELIDLKEHFL